MIPDRRTIVQRGRRTRRRVLLVVAAVVALAGGALVRQVSDRAAVPPSPSPSLSASRLETTVIGVTHEEAGTLTLTSIVLTLSDPLDPAFAEILVIDPALQVLVPPSGRIPLSLAFDEGGASGVGDGLQNAFGLRVDQVLVVSEVAIAETILVGGTIQIEIPTPVREDGEVVTSAGPAVMTASEAVAYLAALFDVSTRSELLAHQEAFWEAFLDLGPARLKRGFDASDGMFPPPAAAAVMRAASAEGRRVRPIAMLEEEPPKIDRPSYSELMSDFAGAWVSAAPPTSRPQVVVVGEAARLAGAMSALTAAGIEVAVLDVGPRVAGTLIETDDAVLGALIIEALGEGSVREGANLPPGTSARILLGPPPPIEGETTQ